MEIRVTMTPFFATVFPLTKYFDLDQHEVICELSPFFNMLMVQIDVLLKVKISKRHFKY